MESGIMAKFKAARALLVNKYKLDFNRVLEFRRDLHQHPEVGYKEVRTRSKIIEYLVRHGRIDKSKVNTYATTGLTYDIRGTAPAQGPNHIIGFRSDMDALPMQELGKLPYASVYPCAAHMCGHDGHMATLIATADVLLRNRHLMPENKAVRLIFQPAEEGGQGGKRMVDEGALNGVDEVYGLHSWCLPFGKFGIKKEGAMTTSIFRFRIDVQGKGSHGAYPENGKDPITALCQTHSAIHTILSRTVARQEMAICTIGEMHAGNTENVIPDTASMGGTVRTIKKEVEDQVRRQLENITEFVPKAFGCEATIKYADGTASVMNSRGPSEAVRKAVAEVLGEEVLTEDMMLASEDFSFMSSKVPAAYMLIGHWIPGRDLVMNHNPRFNYNEDLIAPAALAWIQLVQNRQGFRIE